MTKKLPEAFSRWQAKNLMEMHWNLPPDLGTGSLVPVVYACCLLFLPNLLRHGIFPPLKTGTWLVSPADKPTICAQTISPPCWWLSEKKHSKVRRWRCPARRTWDEKKKEEKKRRVISPQFYINKTVDAMSCYSMFGRRQCHTSTVIILVKNMK